ncbi:MAG: hypothetical protein CMJ31_10115 [Phycisphaerae bacterium]|nr:hypothetical protein [Phycisphaerae bacterium]
MVVDAAGRVRRVTNVVSRHPSVFARLGLALLIGMAFLLTLVLLVPALLIGLILISAYLFVSRIRQMVMGTTEPGGVLDGRRNVRVIDRSRD